MRKWILMALAGLVMGCAQAPRDNSEAPRPPDAIEQQNAEVPDRDLVDDAVSEAGDARPVSSPEAVGGGDDWGDGEDGDDWATSETEDPFAGPTRDWDKVDPWEGFNRKMFGFNEFLDRYALKPAAKGYQAVTPQWLDDTVTRVFSNLGDLTGSLNSVLQWRWGQARDNFGRFAVNTTLGLAGLFDVASELEIPKHKTDLGLTLGRWGVSTGPYLVLPLFGPSTVRDGATIWPSTYMNPVRYLVEDDIHRLAIAGLYAVDLRADLLSLEDNIIGDRYTFIRNFYITQRMKGEGLSRVPGPEPAEREASDLEAEPAR